jgi:hypothetical protein
MRNSSDTIIVRLIGGLGNQMFQYAAGRALALRSGAALKLDVSGFETYGLRRYELDAYPIAATLADAGELAMVGVGAAPPSLPLRILAKLTGIKPPRNPFHYREPHFPFDAKLASQPLPLFMDGYWQSERYFSDIAQTLRAELTPRDAMDAANAATAAEIASVTAVSLHVRRGDYVSNAHTNAYHGVCSLDYYRTAIDHIRAHVSAPHLFVFSDDAEWTRANLTSDLPTTYVSANPPDKGFRDLQLMSLCQHHIIANSSFSWWGAWLNGQPGKIVIAPKTWFSAGGNDTRDLVPEAWVRL